MTQYSSSVVDGRRNWEESGNSWGRVPPLPRSRKMTLVVPSRQIAALGIALCLGACATDSPKPVTPAVAKDAPAAPLTSPLLAAWPGPWGGVPPFGSFQAAELKPALEAAMAESLREVDRIAADPSAPTFENTIEAFERSGRVLERVSAVYGVYTSTLNDEIGRASCRERV